MRTLRSLGETGLIARVSRRLPQDSSVELGAGDDTAVVRPPAGARLLFASDMLVEGVHFLRSRAPARGIGWKALAVNVSDIAAMGGVPRWAVVSIGLPPSTPVRFVDELYGGLKRCARRFGVSIVGGDTNRSPKVVIDVAILGTVNPGRAIPRSGVRRGDALFVTGQLGGSYRSGRHLRFIPRLREAQELMRRVRLHAMIDLSDGLASDLWQVSRASRCVLRVEAGRVPVARSAGSVYHALTDGEDFELLFAVGARAASRVPRRIGRCPVARVGTAVRPGIGVELQQPDGRVIKLPSHGFKHF